MLNEFCYEFDEILNFGNTNDNRTVQFFNIKLFKNKILPNETKPLFSPTLMFLTPFNSNGGS